MYRPNKHNDAVNVVLC